MYIVDDMIDAIIDYITCKINNERYKLIRINKIEQKTKYFNYNLVALGAQ